jgi:hypothetical protein
MRLPLVTAAAILLLASPFAAVADDDEEDDAMFDAMMAEQGPPEVDLGESGNGWRFIREGGVCRMYSFNDPLVLQVDPANPLNTLMRFQLVDRDISEPDGARVQLLVALRGKPSGEFAVHPSTLTVSRATPASYLLPVSIQQMVATYPDGFQLVLATPDRKTIIESDTLGSGRHLAALAQCGQG